MMKMEAIKSKARRFLAFRKNVIRIEGRGAFDTPVKMGRWKKEFLMLEEGIRDYRISNTGLVSYSCLSETIEEMEA